jgi:hypothetical protein
MTTPPSTPPGWYPDPHGAPGQRWWDGSQWTENFQAAGPTGQVRAAGADNAGIALACSIGGILCCGPVAIAGVVMGKNARDEAKTTGRPLDGTMNAAFIIGCVGVALWAIGLLIYVVVLAAS